MQVLRLPILLLPVDPMADFKRLGHHKHGNIDRLVIRRHIIVINIMVSLVLVFIFLNRGSLDSNYKFEFLDYLALHYVNIALLLVLELP